MKKKRIPSIKSAPMLVMRGLANDRLETRERMAVEAFANGWATMEHFDFLTDMHGITILGACTSDEHKPLAGWCKNSLSPVFGAIRERYKESGKFYCTEQELSLLGQFVTKYRDFWMKKPLALYECACDQLNRHYKRMAESAAL